MVLVGIQLFVAELYLAPVFARVPSVHPRRSSHCRSRLLCDPTRAMGALVVPVAVQLSGPGSYLPPVLR